MKINLETKFVISLIFAILVAIFAIQNAASVEINFLFARFTISQALVILVSAIVGAIAVLLISLVKQVQESRRIKELRKEVEILTSEKEEMENTISQLSSNNPSQDPIVLIDESLDYPEKDGQEENKDIGEL